MTARPTVSGLRPGTLYPTGTARLLFSGPGAEGAAGETIPRALWDRLRARDIRPETLLGAWEVSGWPDAPLDERRALAALTVALGEVIDEGSAYLELDAQGLVRQLERLGFDAAEVSAAARFTRRLVRGDVTPSVQALFGAPDGRRPFVLVDEALYPEALWTLESRLADALSRHLSTGRAAETGGTSLRASAEPGALGPEQAAAVQAALAEPLALITGGPGTGKTSAIVSLLRALFRSGLDASDVAVAAPTGRAAQRIAEALAAARSGDGAAVSASTVHRLLGLRPSRRPTLEVEAPEYHAGWRLPHRFVIVDEASMIDLSMMNQLVAAVRDDAHLVLVGDADQLPSVRLGAAFRDLCTALPRHTHRLTTSYRMDPADPAGAAILRVARRLVARAEGDLAEPSGSIAAGTAATATSGGSEIVSRQRARDLTWAGVEHLAREALPELLARWSDEVLGGAAALDDLGACRFSPAEDGRLSSEPGLAQVRTALERHARARLLCVTRTADEQTSADAVNELLHAQFLRVRRTPGERPGADPGLLPGEPVTILRNDYQRGLWNGDQGIIVPQAPATGDPLGVAFWRGDGAVVHGLGELADNLSLGYASTVHKAQGSEYDRVALVLPSRDSPLLTREILYTALTRARRSVVIVGDLALFASGARRRLQRASGLGSKLAAALEAAPP